MVYGGAGPRLSEDCGLRWEGNTVQVEHTVVDAVHDWVTTHDSPRVFPGRGDGHLRPRPMQAVVRELMAAAGIKVTRRAVRSTPHGDLRKPGTDIRDIQDVLRHASIGTTQIYTQMAREEVRKKLPKRFIQHSRQTVGGEPSLSELP